VLASQPLDATQPSAVYDALVGALSRQAPVSRSTSHDTGGEEDDALGAMAPPPPASGRGNGRRTSGSRGRPVAAQSPGGSGGGGGGPPFGGLAAPPSPGGDGGAHPGTASRGGAGKPPMAPGSATRTSRRPRQLYTNYADVATGGAPDATGSGGSFDALLALAEVGAKATAGVAPQRHHAPHHPSATPKSKKPAAVNVHSKRVGRHRRKAGAERLPPGLQGLSMVSGQSPMRAPHSTPHSNNRRGSLTGSGLRHSPSSARHGGGASHLDSPPGSPHRSGAPSASLPPGSLSAWAAACSIDAALLIPAPGSDDAAALAGSTRVMAALHRSSRARRWAVAEWFTPVIDEDSPRGGVETGAGGASGGRGAAAPAAGDQRTFSTWLAHCGLAGISHLRRVEWRAVRAALAKPRRVSLPWLREQRDGIEGDRAKSRTAYGRLKSMGRLGASNLSREELPPGVPRPLAVGERVLAIHPRTRSVHPGQVLTVDVTRCRVQFDRLDLGTEAVADTSVARAHAAAGTQHAARGTFSPAGQATPASARKLAGSLAMSPGASRSVHFHHLPHSGAPAAARALYGTQAPEAVAAVTAVAAAAAAAARGNFPGSPHEAAAAAAHAFATASHEADAASLATLSAALDAKDSLLTQLRGIHTEAEAAAAAGTELGEALVRGHRLVLAALQEANVRVNAGLEALLARARFHDDPTGDDAAAAAAAPQSLSGAALHGRPQDARAVANTISAAVGAALVQSAHALHSAGGQGAQGTRGGGGGTGRQWRWQGAGSLSDGDALLDAPDGLGPSSAAHKLLTDAAADAAQLVASCHAGLRPGGQDTAAPSSAAATTAAAAEAAAVSMASSSGLVKGCVALLQLVRSLADSPGRVPPAHLSQVLDAALMALRPRHGANNALFLKVAAVVADVQGILRTVYASQ
jgi:hypothetical protein